MKCVLALGSSLFLSLSSKIVNFCRTVSHFWTSSLWGPLLFFDCHNFWSRLCFWVIMIFAIIFFKVLIPLVLLVSSSLWFLQSLIIDSTFSSTVLFSVLLLELKLGIEIVTQTGDTNMLHISFNSIECITWSVDYYQIALTAFHTKYISKT